ncbi:MAG: hypothetical protein J6A53_08115 [Clostridia bacterium]|nr:hypothetical protein [Clostridia bacterium]
MKYVFFDIECANCFHGNGKICSFGYVVTDERFKILEKRDIPMNPHSKFHLFGHKNHPGIVLAYDEKTFNSSPDFIHFYKKIRNLLTDKHCMNFGFSVLSDAGYIKSECKRYAKEMFDYEFIDVQRIYTDFKGLDNTPALIKCAAEYGVTESQEIHKSDDDSYFTMRVLKGLCEEAGLTVKELIEKYPHCQGKCKNGEIESEYLKFKEEQKLHKLSKMEKLTGSLRSNWVYRVEGNYDEINAYAKKVYVNRKSDSSLSCKRVCLSGLYEDYHFNEMMNIISLLAENGAKYTKRAYACDVFVTYDLIDKNGKEYKCYRKEKALNAIKSGSEIEIITFDKLLELLNTDENAIKVLDRSKLAPLKDKDFAKA